MNTHFLTYFYLVIVFIESMPRHVLMPLIYKETTKLSKNVFDYMNMLVAHKLPI